MASVHHIQLNDYVADSFREEVIASLVLSEIPMPVSQQLLQAWRAARKRSETRG